MQVHRLSVRPLSAMLALAFGAGFMGSARADDPNPYYIGVSQAFTHDSNVFRTVDSQAKGDTYSSTGILAGIDQPFGRQRFTANGNMRYNRFSDQTALNNTSYGLNSRLDLSTVNHLSGSLSYTLNQGLYNYGGGSLVSLSTKNVEKSQQTAARVSWGLVSLWSIDTNLFHQSLRYSAPAYQFANLDQDAGSVGVTYKPSGLLTLGTALRHTNAKYPQAGYSFGRNDLDLTSTWTPTGQSTVNGRISYGRLKYSNAADSNSITSGSVSWDYRPTGKLGFLLWASRDTGAQSSFFNFATVAGGNSTAVGDNSQRTNTLALTTNYAATSKINLSLQGRYARRSLNNSLVFTGVGTQNAQANDINRVISLAANYQALRSLVFACNVTRDTRGANGTISFPYSSTSFGCSGQFTLQ